ncbi:MAG: hypothetical protein WCC60_24140, partial [Ilumatobacteraceae bacterium]
MIPQPTRTDRSAVPAVVLFALTAGTSLLAGALPVSKYSDSNLFDAGGLQIAMTVVPAVLLVLAAATCNSSRAMVGLGGGAALAAASFMGSMSLAIWNSTDGEGLGSGSTMMIVASMAAVVTVVVALATSSSGRRSALHVVGLIASGLMCIGVTLVPDEARGTSWGDWNYFSDRYDALYTLSVHLLVWAPLLAGLFALIKGGRAGALFGLAGSSVLAWAIADTAVADTYSGEFRPMMHPLAAVGAVATVVLYLIAAGVSGPDAAPSITGAAATTVPPQWAADPFGRFETRYWNGTEWTENVANGGVPAFDAPIPAVSSSMSPSQAGFLPAPTTSMRQVQPAQVQPAQV